MEISPVKLGVHTACYCQDNGRLPCENNVISVKVKIALSTFGSTILGPIYTRQIYPDKLQKLVNICSVLVLSVETQYREIVFDWDQSR